MRDLFESSPKKTPLLTNDQADHHFGVLTWHDLSFQRQVISKSGKEEMAPNCEIDMCKQKCASNGSALDKTRTNVHANTQRYTHKHTPSPKRVNEQTHTHTPSPIRVNEQTQTCTTVHAHKLRLARTHTPVHPPRACAHTKKRNYIENNEPPLNSHNVVDVQQFNEINTVPETSLRLLLNPENFKSHDERID